MGKVLTRLAAAVIGLALVAAAPLSPQDQRLQDQKFQEFVRDFRAEAVAQGIRPATYDLAMGHAARIPRIEELNLNQPEFSRAVWSYLDSAVSKQRVVDGRAGLAANLSTLNAIEARYGVPKEVLVSIWGNESDFGHGHEPFNMFDALATLAYDGPRADYAKPELIAALKMMQQQHYTAQQMTASWAGAFGQTQFTPTTFLAHAADGDGDGVIDLWHSAADALASTANVLADAGWERGNVWGYEVALPRDFPYELADPDQGKPVADWKKLGVRTISGAALPASEEPGAVFLPAGARGPAFLVFNNFKVVLKYNNATSYALAVCLLADRIRGLGPVVSPWPRDEQPLTRDERIAFQTALTKLGYDIGTIDGVLGRKARNATRAWQKAHAVPADGFPTEDLLTRIGVEAQGK